MHPDILATGCTGMSLDPLSLAEQLRAKDAHIAKLAGTLAHYRAWASQIQARYQMFNPDAARPARRIYVGGLPPDSEEVSLPQVCPLTLMPFLVFFATQRCNQLLHGQSCVFRGFERLFTRAFCRCLCMAIRTSLLKRLQLNGAIKL